MNDPKSTSVGWFSKIMLVFLVLLVALAVVDIITDFEEDASIVHLIAEICMFSIAAAGVSIVLRKIMMLRSEIALNQTEISELSKRLETTESDAQEWRTAARKLIDGLSTAIDDQFTQWELSPAEKEVGLLLLKGLTHKEVAAARSVGEATARQQARAIYKKAGLTGRHDLSAFFLEDLMVPATT